MIRSQTVRCRQDLDVEHRGIMSLVDGHHRTCLRRSATTVFVRTESAADGINADHAFLVAILAERTGAILHFRCITDPS